jgi:hypothetical protein
MGGDSAGSNSNWELTVRADEKVFKNGDYLMGFTSSFRMGQLLRYSFNPPVPEEGEDLNKFMATKFVDEVRKCLKNGGYAQKNNEEESGGTFLVGYKGHLFEIEDDYQVCISVDNYNACGCGDQIAKGALYGLEYMNLNPTMKVNRALEAAEKFNAGVRSPFVIISE